MAYVSRMLAASSPSDFQFDKVTVWGAQETLDRIPAKKWLHHKHVPALEGSLFARAFWQSQTLAQEMRKAGCNVLLSPGGVVPRKCPFPVFTVSQNLYPWERKEFLRSSPFSLMRWKLLLLRKAQSRSMAKANGLIFPSQYGRSIILKQLPHVPKNITVIPQGVDRDFFLPPRESRPWSDYSEIHPFRFLYVSTLYPYKHQWNVALAASKLKDQGMPIQVEFIGDGEPSAKELLKTTISRLDPRGEFLFYRGGVPFSQLLEAYHSSDGFVFASTCENLPGILLEAMASGLPIASSSCGPMPEVLGDSGIYFNPENVEDLASAMSRLAQDQVLRSKLVHSAYKRVHAFTWEKCAEKTFSFLQSVLQSRKLVLDSHLK